MILPLSARCSLANLPAIGERVIYATSNGAVLEYAGVVESIRNCPTGPRVVVSFDKGGKGTLLPTSLWREELCK